MKLCVFSATPYDQEFLLRAHERHGHDLVFLEPRLDADTARLAAGFPAVCAFVNDGLDSAVLQRLAAEGARLIALRSTGFNNVDVGAARSSGSPWRASPPTRPTP